MLFALNVGMIMEHKYLTVSNDGPLTYYHIRHSNFEAKISKFGGQLLSFKASNQKDWLWLSNSAVKDGSKAIRGGVPICWPWFGPSSEPDLSQHGYARLAQWEITEFDATEDLVTLRLEPTFSEALNKKLRYSLHQTITLSDRLEIALTTTNISDEEASFTQAIHSYFSIQDIFETEVMGLSGCELYDQLSKQTHIVDGAIKVLNHTDAIVRTNDRTPIVISENDRIEIGGNGFDSIVIWNPWQALATEMSDFDDNGYRNMLCVEMANTQPVRLAPGKSHTLTQSICR